MFRQKHTNSQMGSFRKSWFASLRRISTKVWRPWLENAHQVVTGRVTYLSYILYLTLCAMHFVTLKPAHSILLT